MNASLFCRWLAAASAILCLTNAGSLAAAEQPAGKTHEYLSGKVWPEPKRVEPGPPPSDAIVLFDGKDLSAWNGGDQWKIEGGNVSKPGFVTVLHNGVLVQNHTQIEGTTSWDHAPAYTAHAPKLPLELQYHGNPVRFRNIWIREL